MLLLLLLLTVSEGSSGVSGMSSMQVPQAQPQLPVVLKDNLEPPEEIVATGSLSAEEKKRRDVVQDLQQKMDLGPFRLWRVAGRCRDIPL